jgi:hypothetical protein
MSLFEVNVSIFVCKYENFHVNWDKFEINVTLFQNGNPRKRSRDRPSTKN